MYATLAQERDTGRLIEIDDMQRRNGLYILGKPRAEAHIPPSELPERTFTDADVVMVQIILRRDIQIAIEVIEKFVSFCELLAKPGNHIKVPSGQYIEKEVNLRTEADMVGEKARELIGLPKYTAYAKLLQWKGKMQTLTLREVPNEKEEIALIQVGAGLMKYNSLPYLKRRTEIDWEIRER